MFIDSFGDSEKGKKQTLSLLYGGSDIILPVAGAAGKGSLVAIQEKGSGYVIGFDTDWSATYPDYSKYILSSVVERYDLFVYDSIQQTVEGQSFGEDYLGTIENDGITLVIGKDFIDQISPEIANKLGEVKNLIKLLKNSSVDPNNIPLDMLGAILQSTPTNIL